MDTVGANLIWHAWVDVLPKRVRLTPDLQQVFNALSCHPHSAEAPAPPSPDRSLPVTKLGESILEGARHGHALPVMLGRLIVDLVALIRHPARSPWREISAQIYIAGAQALGITALVGFLIGLVISYLSY